MRIFRFCGLAAALALAVSAMAYPTLSGPTGQAVIPTGYTAGSGFTVAADWQDLEEGSAIPLRVLFGLGSNAELGAAYTIFDDATLDGVDDGGVELDNAWNVNGKFAVGRFLGGQGALGAQWSTFDTNVDFGVDFLQAYFAWTGCFDPTGIGRPNTSLTWGVNWTQADPDVGDTSDAFRFFAGVGFGLTDKLALLAEYQTEDEDVFDTDPISAITARYWLSRTTGLQVGYTNALGGMIGTDNHNLFAGLTFGLGGGYDGGGF